MSRGVKKIDLPKFEDRRGNLSFIEGGRHIPFDIRRAYWIYDVPGGQYRGGHAYRTQQEFIVALSGSFELVVRDARGRTERYFLNRSYYGIYIPALTWRQLTDFSTNSLALVLSSGAFDESDYIYDFDEYKKVCHQLIVAAAGAFDVFLDDGREQRVVTLNRPYYGLHVLPGIWASQREFSSSSICLVLASELYDENDYIRAYDDFLRFTQRL